jgi:hypothetical protein
LTKAPTSREMRNFGILFSAIAAVAAAYFAIKGNAVWPWLLVVTAFFGLAGFFAPALLRPLYVVWMKFAFLLAWVNTRVLLGLFFFVVITPVGVAMRLFGKDLLEKRLDKASPTYWKKRTVRPFHATDYERLF